jgi:HK97 family phage major capsid protein
VNPLQKNRRTLDDALAFYRPDDHSGDNLTGLLQTRAAKVGELRSIIETCEQRGKVSADAQREIDSIDAEIKAFDERIALAQTRASGGPAFGRSGGTGDALRADESMSEWYEARHGGFGVTCDGLTGGDLREFSLGRITAALAGRIDRRELSELETRALAEGTDSAGGFAVPEFLASNLIDRVRAKAQVFNAGALTIPMDSDTLNIARLAGGNTAEWKAENAPAAETDQVFERVQLRSKTAVVLMRLSQELYEDLSAEGLRVVENELVQSLALKLDLAALRGDPDSDPESPRGIRNQSGVNVIDLGANGATPTDFDFLIDAIAAIRDANGTASAAIMASRSQTTLDKLKDSTGQPLRQPESVAALTKYVSNQVPTDLAHGTSNAASEVYVGGFENVLIGVRPQLGIRFRVLNERYADNLQVGLIAWLRADVALAHPEHLSVVTGVIA